MLANRRPTSEGELFPTLAGTEKLLLQSQRSVRAFRAIAQEHRGGMTLPHMTGAEPVRGGTWSQGLSSRRTNTVHVSPLSSSRSSSRSRRAERSRSPSALLPAQRITALLPSAPSRAKDLPAVAR